MHLGLVCRVATKSLAFWVLFPVLASLVRPKLGALSITWPSGFILMFSGDHPA